MKKILMFTNRGRIGSDPELFFENGDGLVPSKDVVPEVKGSGYSQYPRWTIRDGFQGELNPISDTCRQSAGSYIAVAFSEACKIAESRGARVSMKIGHTVTTEVWNDATPDEKRFGCSPTQTTDPTKFKRVTGLRERFRAAGGHIHYSLGTEQQKNIGRIVVLMDIVLANTCVLLDRDPDNAKRRKNYGRAGEHRVKSYGMEYRVLSNFWLRSYTLWSMASQFGRNAIAIENAGLADELIGLVDLRKIRKAINTNDYKLAKENFAIVQQFLIDHEAKGNGLSVARLEKFADWCSMDEPLAQWNTLRKVKDDWQLKLDTNGVGFETFIDAGLYKG